MNSRKNVFPRLLMPAFSAAWWGGTGLYLILRMQATSTEWTPIAVITIAGALTLCFVSLCGRSGRSVVAHIWAILLMLSIIATSLAIALGGLRFSFVGWSILISLLNVVFNLYALLGLEDRGAV